MKFEKYMKWSKWFVIDVSLVVDHVYLFLRVFIQMHIYMLTWLIYS